MKKALMVGVGLVLLGGPLTAAERGVALGVKLGTPGIGAELSKSLVPKANARVGFNLFSYTYSDQEEDITYDLDLKLRTGSGFLDFHPTEGAFRLSAGFLYNKNRIEGVAQSSGTYDIGNATYTGAEIGTLNARADFARTLAPYLGLGFGNAVGRHSRLTFSFDLGVMFQGSPAVKLSATGPIASDPRFQAELAREEADFNADLQENYFKYYPVLGFGLAYQF